MKINGLQHGRGAAILHRITKCARPVTLVPKIAPFMRLCHAPADVCSHSAISVGRPSRPLGFVPKLLRFDEPRGTLSLGSRGSAMTRAHAVARISGRRQSPGAPNFSACNLHIRWRDLRFDNPASSCASYAAAP